MRVNCHEPERIWTVLARERWESLTGMRRSIYISSPTAPIAGVSTAGSFTLQFGSATKTDMALGQPSWTPDWQDDK
jgi:hypothetical protein